MMSRWFALDPGCEPTGARRSRVDGCGSVYSDPGVYGSLFFAVNDRYSASGLISGAVLRIGLINQPIHRMRVARAGAPLSAGSISLGIWHVARRIAPAHDVRVFSRASLPAGVSTLPDNVPITTLPDPSRRARLIEKLRGKLNRVIGAARRGRPYFAEPGFCSEYGRHVSRLVGERELDLVRVHNFFHIVPILRRDHPNLKINLHVHCEWLNQLDESLVAPALEESDYLSGCSHFIADRIREKFPRHANKTFALQNGVDTVLFTPSRAQTNDNIEILYIGRVSPEKGIHVLLESFRQVRKAIPGTRLTILGSRKTINYDYICNDPDPLVQQLDDYFRNNEKYQRELDRLAAVCGAVEFVSDMPQAHLTDRLRRCDVFVYPSVWNEPFGMPVVEAMACAKPVVTTYSGGIPEFVADRQTGRLIERGEVDSLAAALIELSRDVPLRQQMGGQARQFVERNMGWEHVAQRLLDAVR